MHILSFVLALSLFAGCAKDEVIVDGDGGKEQVNPGDDDDDDGGGKEEEKPETPPVFPEGFTGIASVYIDTPGHVGVHSHTDWVLLSTIRITADGEVIYQDDSLKIRGRGNSTWNHYPKKPYYFKLDHQANFFGTGKSKKWVLIANWMDRTLLRNDLAFEAARRTCLDWTPSGEFVELYLDGQDLGLYWLGEKINVEGSKFEADYLYTFDSSRSDDVDYTLAYGWLANVKKAGIPVELKYPDRDKKEYEQTGFDGVLKASKSLLETIATSIPSGKYTSYLDTDSFCDWYIVHELASNLEPRHPKSCFFHYREGKLYAGPVWDFDWGTFIPDDNDLNLPKTLWFGSYETQTDSFKGLLAFSAFKKRLKERWAALKPSFDTLPAYIDARAERIRTAEAANHAMWPCYPNPLSEDGTGMVNHDEQMTFQQAVDRLKSSLVARIAVLDREINAL